MKEHLETKEAVRWQWWTGNWQRMRRLMTKRVWNQ